LGDLRGWHVGLNHAFIFTMKNSTHPNHFITVLLGASLGFCQVSLAADTPQVRGGDAGALMQQNEQSIKPHLPNADTLRLLSLPPPMNLPEQFGMTVRRVYFLGNSRLSKSQLYPAVQPFLNRPLTAADIDQMKAAVTNFYRQSGWIVEVYLPQQVLDQNELTLQVVEDLRHSGKPAR